MKTKIVPQALLFLSLVGLLSACGKSQTAASTDTSSGTSSVASNPILSVPPSSTGTSTSTSTSTGTGGNTPLLVYSISQLGNQVYQSGNLTSTQGNCGSTCSSSYTTAAISTDNVLKVVFKVGANQGNNVGQADLLKVSISVNGTTLTPTYESSNYTYGLVNESSNVLDFSPYLSPGVPTTISVNSPMNDFYCVLWNLGNNPLYNNYPSCYKNVFQTHTWSGSLYVQTSNTISISNAP